MILSRIDLDGFGSPAPLAARIHELVPDLAPAFAIQELCQALDISSISLTDTSAYEAALVMDANKAAGAILLARSSSAKRRRFSIGHELGHFLLPHHMPRPGEGFSCSCDDLRLADTKDRDRHRRIEAEANSFAAHLLMQPAKIRAAQTAPQPDLREIVRLASNYRVSKEAMARTYIEVHGQPAAIAIVRNGFLERAYRSDDFPWIEPRVGQAIPLGTVTRLAGSSSGSFIEIEECDREGWFSTRNAGRCEALTEQMFVQEDGFAMVLLHAELRSAG